jgi:hypothetical protein
MSDFNQSSDNLVLDPIKQKAKPPKRYKVVLLNDDLREIASVDVLETLSRQELISLYAFACKEYMGRPMELGETSLKNVEMILTLRKLAMNNNILIGDMIDKSRGNSGS